MDHLMKDKTLIGNDFSINSLKIEEIIKFLNECGHSLKHKQAQAQISTLINLARKIGLNSDNIIKLVDIILLGKLSERNRYCLVYALIPRSVVPTQIILKVLSYICSHSSTQSVEKVLLSWLAAVYDELENKNVIHSLYNIIFHYLDSGMCPGVCNLLCKATTKEDLKYFHFERLKRICVKTGYSVHTLALLNVYKNLCPNLIMDDVPEISVKIFYKSDSSWRIWINEMKFLLSPQPMLKFWFEDETKVEKNNSEIHFPKIQTAHWFEPSSNHVTLEQIKSFDEWLQVIDKTKLPSQISSILKHPVLHVVYSTYMNEDSEYRLNFWLDHMLTEAFLCNPENYSDVAKNEFLFTLVQYFDYAQVKVPSCEYFLVRFLSKWDGNSNTEPLLMFLSSCIIQPFQDLHEYVLKPVNKLYKAASLSNKVLILKSLNDLFKNYVIQAYWFENYFVNSNQFVSSADDSCEKQSHNNSINDDYIILLDIIQNFIKFMNHFFIDLLKTVDDHVIQTHLLLRFYEMVPNIFLKYHLPVIELPPEAFVYRIIFSCNIEFISRLCNLMCNYKEAFSTAKHADVIKHSEFILDHSNKVAMLNAFLLNISNALWRSTLFTDSSQNSLTFGISKNILKEMKIPHADEAFNINLHWAFIGFTVRFIHLTQGKEVKPRQLLHKIPKSKDVFLDYLKRQNLPGIYHFRQTFLTKKKI